MRFLIEGKAGCFVLTGEELRHLAVLYEGMADKSIVACFQRSCVFSRVDDEALHEDAMLDLIGLQEAAGLIVPQAVAVELSELGDEGDDGEDEDGEGASVEELLGLVTRVRSAVRRMKGASSDEKSPVFSALEALEDAIEGDVSEDDYAADVAKVDEAVRRAVDTIPVGKKIARGPRVVGPEGTPDAAQGERYSPVEGVPAVALADTERPEPARTSNALDNDSELGEGARSEPGP